MLSTRDLAEAEASIGEFGDDGRVLRHYPVQVSKPRPLIRHGRRRPTIHEFAG